MRALRTTGKILVVLGLTVLFFVFYEVAGTSIITEHHQQALAREFDDEVRAHNPVVGKTPSPEPALPRHAVARIVIPKIGVDRIVVEGVTPGDLRYGPGHYPRTPMPGERGAAGIAGHRTTWGAPFNRLDELVAGDMIILQTPRASYRYRVTHSKVVDPGDSWVLTGDPRSTASRRLTLTTCQPKYSAAHRLVVWADLIP